MSKSVTSSSSTAPKKQLITMFESQRDIDIQDDAEEQPSVSNSSSGSSRNTPHSVKRFKRNVDEVLSATTPNFDNKSTNQEHVCLPHETPIGKFLQPSKLSYRMPPKVSQEDIVEDDEKNNTNVTAGVIVTPKRQQYLNWDDYFLGIAWLSSQRSKDPHRAEGACIVDHQNRVVAIGYSGFPRGCPDTVFPWVDDQYDNDDDTNMSSSQRTKQRNWLHTKKPYVCPAITNAILNKCSQDVDGCTLYVTEFPTSDCVKVMIQSGIRELVILSKSPSSSSSDVDEINYEEDEDTDDNLVAPHNIKTDDEQAAHIMLKMAGILIRYHRPAISSVTLDFAIDMEEKREESERKDGSSNAKQTPLPTRRYTAEEQTAIEILQQEAAYNATSVVYNGRRKDYLTWKDYFMSVAFLTAQRSKDPNTQVGACIVDDENKIIGLGYNGMPRGLSDDAMPWSRDSSNPPLFNKYLYVTHAEVNAILNKGSANVKGCTVYVALFPCENCAKMIIQSGIRKIVYLSDRYHDTDGCRASRIMLRCAGVELVQYTPTHDKITVRYWNDDSTTGSINKSYLGSLYEEGCDE